MFASKRCHCGQPWRTNKVPIEQMPPPTGAYAPASWWTYRTSGRRITLGKGQLAGHGHPLPGPDVAMQTPSSLLYDWGVRRIFGYAGDGINRVFGALNRADGKIQFIQAPTRRWRYSWQRLTPGSPGRIGGGQ
jgi:hypothetical protein